MAAAWLGRPLAIGPWVRLGLALDVVLVIGWPIARMAAASLRRGILNQHVRLEFGAWGARRGDARPVHLAGVPGPDFLAVAIFITTYHLLSGWVSLLVRTRSSQAVRRSLDLQPQTARVVADGHETELPIGEVRVGDAMSGMDAGLPEVAGYANGQAIAFVHTEASDPQVAAMLGQMMGSPVLVVPQLADVPDDVLGAVFVFSNGVEPDGPRGPFGLQPDVFDSIPGDAGYRPLRRIHLVSWRAGVTPRLLRSADEIVAAGSAGELAIETSSTVVNMPMIRWPSGNR